MSIFSSFTISERKFFLRIFDILFVFAGINIAASFSDFYYFNLSSSMIVTWFLTLGVYLVLFSQIFEMYSLSNSDDYFKTIRNVVGTSLAITFFYIFTPFVSPELPANRLQIIYLFLAIAAVGAVLLLLSSLVSTIVSFMNFLGVLTKKSQRKTSRHSKNG